MEHRLADAVDNRFPLELNLDSLAGHAVDYYFIYGPEMDQLIHEYRNLTGHTPMLPKWSYGFFQSKDRYVSQEEVLGIAHRIVKSTYRSTQLFRTGFGGKQKAIRSSIRTSPMSPVNSSNSMMNTSMPCFRFGGCLIRSLRTSRR